MAARATVNGSAQTASASVQVPGTGQANWAGTATRSASTPGALKPRLIRCGQPELRPARQARQRRHGKFGSMITRWPIRLASAPGPAPTISPVDSCPGTQGSAGGGR